MHERLSPELNISHVAPDRPAVPLGLVVKHYLASATIYGLLLVLLVLNPWFKSLLQISFKGLSALHVYFCLYGFYLVAALPVLALLRPRSLWGSKNLLIAGVFLRLARQVLARLRGGDAGGLEVSYREKHALMFLLIKLFYGPLMLNSAFGELNRCRLLWPQFDWHAILGVLDTGYIFFVSLVFLLDSVLFFIGYHTEAGFLKNEVRYVETNPLHILVTIACYAPFSVVAVRLLGPSVYDPYILVLGDFRSPWTWLLRGAAVLFLTLLTAASFSLFTKASNLTNRGIVTWGPYRFIRHPGYLAKNLFWLMTTIPLLIVDPSRPGFSWAGHLFFSFCTLCGFVAWATIYFLRAITEERFLSRDPEYVAYCQRVKYRFIPGVY